eukprot:GHVR01091395.1.p1 GENE.GHVR01091395.1~~GHVR01091395.1.p1  ORF type:complete len:142 (+),score=0.05 GHVR01091395.1:115-540(+)
MSSKVLTAGNIKFLIAACSYIVVSITTVVFHKQLFKSKYSFPVFLTGFQQCVGLVILIIMGEIGRITKNDNIRSIFPPVRVEKRGFLMVYYCAIFFVSYLSIANTCLKEVHVITYQLEYNEGSIKLVNLIERCFTFKMYNK